jgi:hypothetical protein
LLGAPQPVVRLGEPVELGMVRAVRDQVVEPVQQVDRAGGQFSAQRREPAVRAPGRGSLQQRDQDTDDDQPGAQRSSGSRREGADQRDGTGPDHDGDRVGQDHTSEHVQYRVDVADHALHQIGPTVRGRADPRQNRQQKAGRRGPAGDAEQT